VCFKDCRVAPRPPDAVVVSIIGKQACSVQLMMSVLLLHGPDYLFAGNNIDHITLTPSGYAVTFSLPRLLVVRIWCGMIFGLGEMVVGLMLIQNPGDS
jgi:hypothetical protein